MHRLFRCALPALAVMVLFTASPAAAARLLVDGRPMRTSPRPVIRGGRMFIPVTAFRQVGLAVQMQGRRRAWVAWPESDGFNFFIAGKRVYHLKGYEPYTVILPGTPFMYRGTLMVPLRALLSHGKIGTMLTADWDRRTMTANLRREKHWLKWRRGIDRELRARKTGWYASPI